MNDSTQHALDSIMAKINELKDMVSKDRFNLTDDDICSLELKIDQLGTAVKDRYESRG